VQLVNGTFINGFRSYEYSMANYTRAMVRPPALTYVEGLTTANLGKPIFEKALEQHRNYCLALQECGLTLTVLEPDDAFPDSTFVEDPAILLPNAAVLTRPGAPSRRSEAATLAHPLREFYSRVLSIQSPGTVDGGDVFRARDQFFIGISKRTNEEGARQLTELLAREGFASTTVALEGRTDVLHLQTGASYLGENRLVVIEELADDPAFSNYDVIRVPHEERYAANMLAINDRVIIAEGFPNIAQTLTELGYSIISLGMSEFQKMDGSLTCLSLRF
jgi:dimethylargininase